MERCFVCGKKLKFGHEYRVFCEDDQVPFVGTDCFRRVASTSTEGLKTFNGPRVFAEPVPGVRYSFLGEAE